jgi:hypothetical protein
MLTKLVSLEFLICQIIEYALLFKMMCLESTDFITCLDCFKWINT